MTDRYRTPDLSRLFDEGVKLGATHMIVVYQPTGVTNDRTDHNDRHFYVMPGQDVLKEIRKHQGKLEEVYNLSLPKAEQLAAYRSFNY